MGNPTMATGCVLDGVHGWHNNYRIIDLAMDHGMPMTDPGDIVALRQYRNGQHHAIGVVEAVDEMAEEALTYLNENVADPGHWYEWHDGDLMYWSEAQSCAASGDRCQCTEPHDHDGEPLMACGCPQGLPEVHQTGCSAAQ